MLKKAEFSRSAGVEFYIRGITRYIKQAMPGAPAANAYRYSPAQIAASWDERIRLDDRVTAEQLLSGAGAAESAVDGTHDTARDQRSRARRSNEHLRKLKCLRDTEREARRDTERELKQLHRAHELIEAARVKKR